MPFGSSACMRKKLKVPIKTARSPRDFPLINSKIRFVQYPLPEGFQRKTTKKKRKPEWQRGKWLGQHLTLPLASKLLRKLYPFATLLTRSMLGATDSHSGRLHSPIVAPRRVRTDWAESLRLQRAPAVSASTASQPSRSQLVRPGCGLAGLAGLASRPRCCGRGARRGGEGRAARPCFLFAPVGQRGSAPPLSVTKQSSLTPRPPALSAGPRNWLSMTARSVLAPSGSMSS